MRRVLVLVLVAAAAAVVAGLTVPSSALTVNAASLSHPELNSELAAIDASPSWQCYLQALAFTYGQTVTTAVTGVPTQAWSTPLTVEWTNERTTDLAVVQYVQIHDPAGLAPAALPAAQVSLESAITGTIDGAYNAQAGRGSFTCSSVPTGVSPPSGAQTLASMPSWFQHDQITAEAADLALVTLLPSSLPTSGPGLDAWYARRAAQFDTICPSVIVVTSTQEATVVAAKIRGGLSFAEAAKRYSKSPSAAKGGTLGCYGPTSPEYQAVRYYVGSVPVNGLSRAFQTSSGVWLFTVSKRTHNPLDAAREAVVAAVSAINQRGAATLAVQIQRAAHVTVSSSIGRFVRTALGGTIVPPPQPPAGAVLNASANSP